MNLLITGGAGFIGSNFVHYMIGQHQGNKVVNLDKLTYAGNLENLETIKENPNYFFEKRDIVDRDFVKGILEKYQIDALINFAAESHVDRSILGGAEFIQTNVVGTHVLLELAKEFPLKKFVQVSTDEVYGSLGPVGKFTETTPLHPNSPYASSKAAADLIALSYHHTFNIPVVITRCSNNYGPYQFPEKLIPLMITNALENKSLPVYGDGLNVRDWLHVKDHCSAIFAVLERGRVGEMYNIGGNAERQNIDIVKLILRSVGKPESLITYVKDRLGHDKRYAIDSTKIQQELKWGPSYSFEDGIAETVEWYLKNQSWWKRIISGEYQQYYKKMYGDR